MKPQRSPINPPSTGRMWPTVRKFFIWQDRSIDYSSYRNYRKRQWGRRPWRWCCTFCEPPSYGFQARTGAWQRILHQTMPRHMFNRRSHHEWAASKPMKPER